MAEVFFDVREGFGFFFFGGNLWVLLDGVQQEYKFEGFKKGMIAVFIRKQGRKVADDSKC